MTNEIINENQEQIKEITEKIVFTTGEKTALTCFTCGVALIGYAGGRLIVEPLVKKAWRGGTRLAKKCFSSKETKIEQVKEEKTDENVEVKQETIPEVK